MKKTVNGQGGGVCDDCRKNSVEKAMPFSVGQNLPAMLRECYNTLMEKNVVRILRNLKQSPADDFVAGTPAGRIAMVWPITEELASLSPKHNVEQRLQRDVAVLKRRES